MRSVVMSNRIQCLYGASLKRVALLSLVGFTTIGCSSDVTRFDRQLYAALPKAQPTAYEQAVAANQAYPGSVDSVTTASTGPIGSAPRPLSSVSPQTVPDHVPQQAYQYPNGQPAVQPQYQPQYSAPSYQPPTYQTPAVPQRRALSAPAQYTPPAPTASYTRPAVSAPTIAKSALPKLSAPKIAAPKIATPKIVAPVVTAPALPQVASRLPSVPSASALPRYATDNIQTNSIGTASTIKQNTVAAIAPAIVPSVAPTVAPALATAGAAASGWSKIGGTAIQLRSGETLYNLSKRYGVPVTEIMKANSISDVNALQAGQQILIPTYVYSQNAPVSAPDSHPDTKAARSSTGLLGQAYSENVPYPIPRPEYHAALSSGSGDSSSLKRRYKPKRSAAEPEGQANPPDYSIVTGSVAKPASVAPVSTSGTYTVKSGDNLGKIALMHGVKVADLKHANGLSGSMIRLGQVLKIPTGGTYVRPMVDPIQTSSTNLVPANVDPIVTGSVKPAVKPPVAPKPYVKPTVDKTISTGSVGNDAPKRTGINSLRWPVTGRVVSKFSNSNDGIDISVPEGTSVKAAENGVVIYSGDELAGFGNLVLLRHADGLVTAYAHNKKNSVAKGDHVSRGQVIALSGRTGNASSPKLHFEVRKNSKPVDPMGYLGG